ncbi:snf2 chromatin remodeling protein [Ceraceosorus bombacis]|uniref:Snf2 chromatin remodeling protein n=1 Tax=Ceraceosorus bombacis TaxID=401625 RepID=A0A0P1BP80_9BASI|nr:snf2 chromatin remodeling protein [Ceraceosorus bombacis]
MAVGEVKGGGEAAGLDRLVGLLAAGSNPTVRNIAAQQLGQICALRMHGGGGSNQAGSSSSSSAATRAEVIASSSASSSRLDSARNLSRTGPKADWNEALSLLARILPSLRSNAWDTRIAAASAVELVCAAAGTWDPYFGTTETEEKQKAPKEEGVVTTQPSDRMSFGTFAIANVLSTGKKLLSSTGTEYDVGSHLSVEERLANAKKDMERLGLIGMAGEEMDIGVDVESELKGASDTAAVKVGASSSVAESAVKHEESASQSPAAPPEIDMSKLSARERNQLKRKRKLGIADSTPSSLEHSSSDNKKRILETSSGSASPRVAPGPGAPQSSTVPAGGTSSTSQASRPTSLTSPDGEWPFKVLHSLLQGDLFAAKWEVRHGAALGLRSLYATQGSGGGMCLYNSSQSNVVGHEDWSNDAALRLACVLALDRLADFVFDHVVTPVRETAAQALAALLRHISKEGVEAVQRVLVDMVKQDWVVPASDPKFDVARQGSRRLDAGRRYKGYAWEARHSGLLGIRWLVSVRTDLLEAGQSANDNVKKENAQGLTEHHGSPSDLLKRSVQVAVACLRDEDDDVRHVAAQALLPVAEQIVKSMPMELDVVLSELWACLGDLKDDLSSSAAGVMDLLSKLVSQPAVIERMDASGADSLSLLVPSLFPSFRHTISSVRQAVLNVLSALLDSSSASTHLIDDKLLRLLFQNLIVEEKSTIRALSATMWEKVLVASLKSVKGGASGTLADHLAPHLDTLFQILMTPIGMPFNLSLFYRASGRSTQGHDVDKHALAQDLSLVGVDVVIRSRLGAAKALGGVFASWNEDDADAFGRHLKQYVVSTSALQRCLAYAVVQEWAVFAKSRNVFDILRSGSVAQDISSILLDQVAAPPPPTYGEMSVMLQRIQLECQGLFNTAAREVKVPKASVPELPSTVDPLGTNAKAFTVELARYVVSTGLQELIESGAASSKAKKVALEGLQERVRKLVTSLGRYQATKEQQDCQVFAGCATALVALETVPAKLNPLIKSLMNAVKFEENIDLQMRAARGVASLVALCSRPDARANPSDKIIKNLCAFVCQDISRTPIFTAVKADHHGVLFLREQSSVPSGAHAAAKTEQPDKTEEQRQGELIRRGAEAALGEVAEVFGKEAFTQIPTLWDNASGGLASAPAIDDDLDDAKGQAILDSCTLIGVLVPRLHTGLQGKALEVLSPLTQGLRSRYTAIRGAAARTLSVLADNLTERTLLHIVEQVLPLLGDATHAATRQGAVETLAHVIKVLDVKILPYVILLVVPVLGRMSDVDEQVRLTATSSFASLIKMVPLEAGLPDPPGFSKEILLRREQERTFLAQLLDGSRVEPYELPVKINADLRSYQRDGVSWMAFLSKFQLHGILCDDMGLGKTLQSICIVSARHHERALRFAAGQPPDATPLPSLIVCPPTLVGHWHHEVQKYANNLRPVMYVGQPQDRRSLQARIRQFEVVITSYDVVRNDVDFLSSIDWLYCILDEGHIIKNAKTKTTQAVKKVRAQHRLLLSGTPIQNNVLELWSLFDFLMPGFLGTEQSFQVRYAKPIGAAREGKVSSREQEAATLALEALHKQVLPFLLRRLKEDVLDDLPPKIIQDIECELGLVQRKLYDDYQRSANRQELEDALSSEQKGSESDSKQQHVFQELQYLRKLVNHPTLVFDQSRAKHREIEREIVAAGGSLQDISHAPKLLALQQLLNDCGIGVKVKTEASDTFAEGAVAQHRVLIFCQLKQMLDIVEQQLFQVHMPDVSYMRLDGSVSADKRHGIVQTFNSDPSIDVLLLTTSVGGLGLTLTGADTVIFVEHDWNPMRDLQAMDRAHRLGQKKVVNVYRLITRDTLEAKIMGLQRFKLNVAHSVVTQQNAGLESMETDQVLDLFGSADEAQPNGSGTGKASSKGISQQALLAAIENAPDTGDDYQSSSTWTI